MTYNVFGGTLSLPQSINQSINQTYWKYWLYEMLHANKVHSEKFRDQIDEVDTTSTWQMHLISWRVAAKTLDFENC